MWSGPYGLHCNDLIRGYQLSAHIREVHGVHGSDKTRVTCHWHSCNMEFNMESLSRHIAEVHLCITYPCDTCGSAFWRRDTLNRHMKIRHP
ncbi:hypothetical protein P692DRAFT_20851013 [Suillus brevipes Sb2]|nr:hypothetical protein P692DRAFT_20851013 [Suillus brevipes Sb2]